MFVSLLMTLVLASAPAPPPPAEPLSAALEADWIANRSDNICGLSDLRAVSDPAVVDYDELWRATPEIKKLEDEDIDPDSAAGIALQQAATDRIREAADEVRGDEDHCSVWKAIRHKDGRDVPDITDEVAEKFPDELPERSGAR